MENHNTIDLTYTSFQETGIMLLPLRDIQADGSRLSCCRCPFLLYLSCFPPPILKVNLTFNSHRHVLITHTMSFPPGDNCSDALISGTHYNLTTLRHWNYTYYVANKTISNSSTCFLLFPPYMPHLLQNGTFLNSTSCYSPILPLGVRSKIGIGFSSLFLLSLILTLVNFKSHDPSFHLPTKKLHSARRWQCFWLLLTNTCALIAGLVGVDVDRYYLPELPLVLYNVFWFLAVIATMASVAESAWLWACWHESLDDLSTTILSRDEWWMKIRFPLRLLFYICLCVVSEPFLVLQARMAPPPNNNRTSSWSCPVLGQTSKTNGPSTRPKVWQSQPPQISDSRSGLCLSCLLGPRRRACSGALSSTLRQSARGPTR